MKKLLLVILFSYLFPHMLSADQLERKIRDFSKWLNLNGYDQYLDKTGDPVDMVLDRSLCTSKSYWDECVGADGKLIPTKDRKVTLIYPTNLKLKLNKKKITLLLKQTRTETHLFIIYGDTHLERRIIMRLNLLKSHMNYISS